MTLDELIDEGLRNSPEILASQARADAAGYRIPQAKSLPDPMFMFGYQNEGFQSFTLGSADAPQAMGMSSLSQMFYFPGKRALKGEMATRDAESLAALSDAAKHRVVAQIKVVFYDLFLAYKTLDILEDRTALFSKIEDAAQSRYASGTGMQQEVIMAQTEKYMILEKEEMQRQRMQALQGMLNATVGREVGSAPRQADPASGHPVSRRFGGGGEHGERPFARREIEAEDGGSGRGKGKDGEEGVLSGCYRGRELVPEDGRHGRYVEPHLQRQSAHLSTERSSSKPWPRLRPVFWKPDGS